jgi:hypothetical protein
LRALNSELRTSAGVTKSFPGNGYIFIAVPASFGLDTTFVINGLSNNNFEQHTRPVYNLE